MIGNTDRHIHGQNDEKPDGQSDGMTSKTKDHIGSQYGDIGLDGDRDDEDAVAPHI